MNKIKRILILINKSKIENKTVFLFKTMKFQKIAKFVLQKAAICLGHFNNNAIAIIKNSLEVGDIHFISNN